MLSWISSDLALLAAEVGGALAGQRVVHMSAGKYRTAVATEQGDIFMWEGWSKPLEGAPSGGGSGGRSGTSPAPGHKGALSTHLLGKSPDGARCGLTLDPTP